MKVILVLFSLIFISCSSEEIKTKIIEQEEVLSEQKISKDNQLIKPELTFEETQDSLRILLLNSKTNNNLKSSILQELYIRGLVNQIDDKIKFQLPFDLHSFDCGAPDCYSTDISFEIPVKEPIEFPKKINYNILEHGCIDREESDNGVFELMEKSSEYVNYYSRKHKSNLIIIEKKQLYYFPESKSNSIKVDLIDKIFDDYNDEDQNGIVPFQSTIMTTNEYERFIKNE